MNQIKILTVAEDGLFIYSGDGDVPGDNVAHLQHNPGCLMSPQPFAFLDF